MNASIGLIGMGLLGSALGRRLVAGGVSVIGHDPAVTVAGAGITLAGSAHEVARLCPQVVLCLPDSTVVESVLTEMEPRPGVRILDTTTGDPERSEQLASRLGRLGVAYLDACVLGSSVQAEAGQAIGLVGGTGAQIDQERPVLDRLFRQWFHVGTAGAGARMKLVVNLVLGLNRAVLAEGLALARATGLNLDATLEVLRAGAAYSRVMDTKGEKMIRAEFSPEARLAQHLKDVRLIKKQGDRVGVALPLSETHSGLLEQVLALGGGDQDNSAVIRAYWN